MKLAAKSLGWWLLVLAGCHSLTYVARDGGEAGSGENMLPCVDNKFCVRGEHWDRDVCACVEDAPGDAGAARDAGGPVCIENQLCLRGLHWDRDQCACVVDADAGGGGSGGARDDDAGSVCIENQACIFGRHWDRAQCACVVDAPVAGDGAAGGAGVAGVAGVAGAAVGGSGGAGGAPACVDNQACVQGSHWDSVACACVPDGAPCGDAICSPQEQCCQVADPDDGTCISQCASACPVELCTPPAPDAGAADSCEHARDCTGPLPQLCQVCGVALDLNANLTANAGSGCAHWACKSHQCELAFCD